MTARHGFVIGGDPAGVFAAIEDRRRDVGAVKGPVGIGRLSPRTRPAVQTSEVARLMVPSL
jgi:hypothetical protein